MLTVLCLAEDDGGVCLEALVCDLKALGDDFAVQVVLALLEEHLANAVVGIVDRRKLVHAEDVGVVGALAQLAGDAIGIQGLGIAQPGVVVVGIHDLVAALGLAFAAAAPASAQQAAKSEARTAPGGVLVTWKLAQPTTEVAFVDQDIIRTLWTVKTPGLSLSDGVVKSDQPFDAFSGGFPVPPMPAGGAVRGAAQPLTFTTTPDREDF